MFMVVKASWRLGLSGCHMTPLWPCQANLQGITSITVQYNLVAGLRYMFEQLCGLLRERCERRHAVGVVLPLRELGPEAGSTQKVLPDPGWPRLSHLCVRSVLSNVVLHHNSWGPGAHRTKQGTVLHRRSLSTCRQHEQLLIHVCNMQMFCFFSPFPSRSLIFQWLLLQKTSTLRSMQPSTECSAGTVRATHCLHSGLSTVLPLKHFECVSMCRMYIKHGSPVKMMEAYVTVLTKGICQSDENGSFLINDYDVRKAYLAASVKGQSSSHMLCGRF